MTNYLLGIYQPDGFAPEPAVLDPIMDDTQAVMDDMKASGVWVFDYGLTEPDTATVLHYRDGELLTTDGPFTEAKEHLGGFVIIDVPDLDAALDWGRRTAKATTLPIEVRAMQRGD